MNDHHIKFSNLSSWKEKPEKSQGFNGIRTRDLRDTGAMLYQQSPTKAAKHHIFLKVHCSGDGGRTERLTHDITLSFLSSRD